MGERLRSPLQLKRGPWCLSLTEFTRFYKHCFLVKTSFSHTTRRSYFTSHKSYAVCQKDVRGIFERVEEPGDVEYTVFIRRPQQLTPLISEEEQLAQRSKRFDGEKRKQSETDFSFVRPFHLSVKTHHCWSLPLCSDAHLFPLLPSACALPSSFPNPLHPPHTPARHPEVIATWHLSC